AEGQVLVRVPGDVEGVGVGEHGVVPVGGRVQQQERVARGDLASAEDGVPGGGAGHVLDRGHPAQHLLDRGGDAGRVGGEGRALVGVPEQLPHPAGDDVPGRLVPADEDEQRLLEEGVVVEPLAVDGGVGEGADEVVAGAGAAVGDDGGGVLVEAGERVGGAVEQGGVVAAGQRPQHVVGPGQQLLAVLGREAEGV